MTKSSLAKHLASFCEESGTGWQVGIRALVSNTKKRLIASDRFWLVGVETEDIEGKEELPPENSIVLNSLFSYKPTAQAERVKTSVLAQWAGAPYKGPFTDESQIPVVVLGCPIDLRRLATIVSKIPDEEFTLWNGSGQLGQALLMFQGDGWQIILGGLGGSPPPKSRWFLSNNLKSPVEESPAEQTSAVPPSTKTKPSKNKVKVKVEEVNTDPDNALNLMDDLPQE